MKWQEIKLDGDKEWCRKEGQFSRREKGCFSSEKKGGFVTLSFHNPLSLERNINGEKEEWFVSVLRQYANLCDTNNLALFQALGSILRTRTEPQLFRVPK